MEKPLLLSGGILSTFTGKGFGLSRLSDWLLLEVLKSPDVLSPRNGNTKLASSCKQRCLTQHYNGPIPLRGLVH